MEARWAHNPEVVGSEPTVGILSKVLGFLFFTPAIRLKKEHILIFTIDIMESINIEDNYTIIHRRQFERLLGKTFINDSHWSIFNSNFLWKYLMDGIISLEYYYHWTVLEYEDNKTRDDDYDEISNSFPYLPPKRKNDRS